MIESKNISSIYVISIYLISMEWSGCVLRLVLVRSLKLSTLYAQKPDG